MTSRSRRKYPLKAYFLYYYGKAIGLFPLSLSASEEQFLFSRGSILYVFILCSVYSLIFCKSIVYRFKTTYPVDTTISAFWDKFLQISQYLVIIITWMNFGFRQKKLQNIIKDVKKTSKITKIFEIQEDNFDIIGVIANYALFVNILYLGLLFIEIYLHFTADFHREITVRINPVFRIVYHNFLFLFISGLHIVYQRFRQLNFRLRHFLVFYQNCPKSLFRISNSKITTNIEFFGSLHNELLDLINSIINFCFLPILMALAINFVQIVATINIMYLHLKNKKEWSMIMTNIVGYILIWLLILISEFFIISSVSGNLTEVANNTGNVLHEIWTSHRPIGCEKVIKKVSLMLLRKKANISLCGFLTLNYGFIYSICGIVTTYLIITLQLN